MPKAVLSRETLQLINRSWHNDRQFNDIEQRAIRAALFRDLHPKPYAFHAADVVSAHHLFACFADGQISEVERPTLEAFLSPESSTRLLALFPPASTVGATQRTNPYRSRRTDFVAHRVLSDVLAQPRRELNPDAVTTPIDALIAAFDRASYVFLVKPHGVAGLDVFRPGIDRLQQAGVQTIAVEISSDWQPGLDALLATEDMSKLPPELQLMVVINPGWWEFVQAAHRRGMFIRAVDVPSRFRRPNGNRSAILSYEKARETIIADNISQLEGPCLALFGQRQGTHHPGVFKSARTLLEERNLSTAALALESAPAVLAALGVNIRWTSTVPRSRASMHRAFLTHFGLSEPTRSFAYPTDQLDDARFVDTFGTRRLYADNYDHVVFLTDRDGYRVSAPGDRVTGLPRAGLDAGSRPTIPSLTASKAALETTAHEYLRDPRPPMQHRGVLLLHELGQASPASTARLIEVSQPAIRAIRSAAYETMARLAAPKFIAHLWQVIQHGHAQPEVVLDDPRPGTIVVLSDGGRLMNRLPDGDNYRSSRTEAAAALGTLLRLHPDSPHRPEFLAATAQALTRALEEPSRVSESQVLFPLVLMIQALGELGDPGAVDPLMGIARAQSLPIGLRVAAARALGKLRVPRALPALRRLYLDTQAHYARTKRSGRIVGTVRSTIIDTLGTAMLAAQNANDRARYAQELKQHAKHPEARAYLLTQSDEGLRAWVENGLEHIMVMGTHPKYVPPHLKILGTLRRLAFHPLVDVRRGAVKALSRHTSRESFQVLGELICTEDALQPWHHGPEVLSQAADAFVAMLAELKQSGGLQPTDTSLIHRVIDRLWDVAHASPATSAPDVVFTTRLRQATALRALGRIQELTGDGQ